MFRHIGSPSAPKTERRPGGPAGPYPGESSNPAVRQRARRERATAKAVGETPMVPYLPPTGPSAQRAAELATEDRRRTRRRREASAGKRTLAASRRRTATREQRETRERRQVQRTEQRLERRQGEREAKRRKSKPKTYAGLKTAGTPTLGELRRADRAGKLESNRRGFVVTPKVRKASRRLTRAEAKAPKAVHDVAGIDDPEIRKAIARYGHRVDEVASDYGLTGEALLSKLVQGESNEEQGAVSSAQAKSITQFIPETRADFVDRFGVDPWRSKGEAVLAATMHLDGKHGYTRGLEGYNPGGGADYVRYILEQPVGGSARAGKAVTPAVREARKQAAAVGLRRAAGPAAVKLTRKVVSRFKAGFAAAKELERAKLPYVWGGGHGDPESRPTGGGLDCSGTVSYVLNKMGVMKGSLVSGDMGSVLEPGPGAVTVFYNPTHTFMRIGDRYFGTSRTNPGGGAGFIEGKPDDLSKYSVGHVPGLGAKVAVAMGVPLTEGGTPSFPGMSLSESGTSATIASGAGVKQEKPGFSKGPIRLTPSQRARRTLRAVRQVDLGASREAGEVSATLSELERRYGVSTG